MSTPQITHLEKEEFEEMMIFLEKSYGASHYFFPRDYPHIWSRDTIQYENRIIAKEDGRIVSHVGIFPLTAAVGDARVRIGGIGGVATLPEFRGKGYMRKLMNYSVRKMKEDKYAISILWGDRQRYGNFGYEVAGRMTMFELTQRSLETAKLSPVNIIRLEEKKELLKKISIIHRSEPLHIERKERDYALIFSRPNLITVLGEKEGKFAYLSFYNHVRAPKNLVECGGNLKILFPLIYAFLKNWDIKSIQVPFPDFPTSMFSNLLKVSSNWHTRPLGMIKVLNLPETIESYAPIIEKRAQELRLKGELAVEIKEKREKVTLCLDSQLTFKEGGPKERISLPEREMVRLLFGSPNLVNVGCPSSLLYTLFPLPLYVGWLDSL